MPGRYEMASNNRVEVHVGANTSSLSSGMNEAESVVENSARHIEATGRGVNFQVDTSGVQRAFDQLSTNISNQMLNLGKTIATALGSALAVDGLVNMASSAVNTAAEVKQLSDMLGSSVEEFQYFAAGAQTAGLSLEQYGQMGKDALDRLGEARRGEGEMMDFFEKVAPKIGITIDQFKELSGPEVLQAYYDGLERANISHPEMITYMEQIVDDGSMLIPLLRDGGAGFKKWGEEAQAAGAIMSKDMVDNLGVAKDNLYTLQLQFQGFQAVLINSITPAVTAIANNFNNVKAVVIALGAAISVRLVAQCAVLAKEFVVGVAQGVAYQVQLSALQGQAIRTATAMGVLRSASAFLGGPAGLAMLAVQGVAAGAAFLYMKKSSEETTPAISTQGKTVAELRAEYERLDQAQQRVLTRKATDDLDKATQAFKSQELALLGLVRVITKHSEASYEDKQAAQSLYDEYLKGRINADQLATGINNLKTVEDKHKKSIDEKSTAVSKEQKAVSAAEGVLKSYNSATRQSTSDNEKHTKSINDKANAYANLTAKQMEYVNNVNKSAEAEQQIKKYIKDGMPRERAEHRVNALIENDIKPGTEDKDIPKAVLDAEKKSWDLKQQEEARANATKAAAEADKKAEDSKKRQVDLSEKQYSYTKEELKMLQHVAELSSQYDLDGIGAKYGIPKNYLAGLMAQESGGNRNAVSPTGAIGYFQTTGDYRKDNNISVADSKNLPVVANVVAKNLANAFEKLGSWEAAIRSHNAGVAGSAQFEKTGRVTGSNARNKEVAGFAPAVNKWIVGLGGSNLKSGGMSKSGSTEAIQDYKEFEDNKIDLAEKAEREKIDLQYQYANATKQIAIDLQNSLKAISESTLSDDEKKAFSIKAEQEAADKIKEIRIEQFEQLKSLFNDELEGKMLLAQRIYDIEMAQLDASLKSGDISNVEKVKQARILEETLYMIKRQGLEDRLVLESELGTLTGDTSDMSNTSNQIGGLDNSKTIGDIQYSGLISDAEMQDFEEKFGGLTERISGLWDKGMQSMMNGTLTWKNATNAILTDLGAYFLQTMVSDPLKAYMMGLSKRLAVKLGFIKTETAAEVTGQAAQTTAVVAGEATKTTATGTGVLARLALKAGEAIKSIMMYAWEAMAGAFKAMVSIPYVGPVLAVAAGASALALVGGLAGKIKSARGGYDIPAGVNPVTQLHEEEMVLPKQHANTIRALGRSMSGGGAMAEPTAAGGAGGATTVNIQAWDSRDIQRFMKKNGKALAGSLKSYNRGFGK